ncbi:MAG: tetratricopeptide repeat protein [Spirochaetes bacterium]|nr:tetratricopeptide repeat protein [Spirochaetota bacterium]
MKKSTFILILLISAFISVNLYAGYHEQGKTAYMYKNYDKAITAFTKAVEANPKDGNSYYFMGEINKKLENFPQAIEYYNLAIDNYMDKKYIKLAYWSLIILYEQNNDILNTVKTCRKYWEKTNDSSVQDKVNEMINKMLWTNNDSAKQLYEKGKILEGKNSNDEAVQSYKNAISEDNEFLAPKYKLGMYYLSKNQENEAAFYFKAITDKIPFYTAVNLLLADIYFSNNSFTNAAVLYSNVLDYGFIGKNTKYKSFLKRGTCYYKNKEYDNAVADMTECQKLNPKDTKPMYVLSAIFIQNENYQEAVKILQKLSTYAPNDSQVIFQLGSIYYKEQNEKFAVYFDRLFDIEQNKKNDERNTSYYKAYKILLKQHFLDKSYQRAIQIASSLPASETDYDTNIILAEAFYFTGSYDKAVETFEKLSLNDEKKMMLVKAYLKNKDREKAKYNLNLLITNSENSRIAAEKDTLLAPLVKEIDKEKTNQQKKLEQEKKAEEEKAAKEKEDREKAAAEINNSVNSNTADTSDNTDFLK